MVSLYFLNTYLIKNMSMGTGQSLDWNVYNYIL